MSSLEGPGGISPEKQKVYKQDCLEGTKLFQEALKKHHETTEGPKKAAFKDVMDKALQVINQTAKWGCNNKKLEQEKENDLKRDYNAYLGKENQDNYEKLQQDIDQLKRSME